VRDTRTFDYDYDSVGNRKWIKRDGGNGDVFAYDLADQVNGVKLDVPNPSATPTPTPNITYDANGNRTDFHPYGTTETYGINNLSQYTSRTIANVTSNATYDTKGNLILSPDPVGSQLACTYDAQNRLISASKGGVTMNFKYDGLNRQVWRRVAGQPNTFSVWDGWDLIEEYQAGGATTAAYVYGASGLIAGVTSGYFNYYYQDGSGSTSHIADENGNLREWYRYDLQGTPFVNGDSNNHASAFGVRHLFTGQQWYSQLGLYDLRNRFYSPDIGRFLQADPSGFDGDPTNLYRYCGNNPITFSDPTGTYPAPDPRGWYTYIVNPGYESNIGRFVPGSRGWCAWGAQILSGAPNTGDWFQGASLTSATASGTVVASGWVGGGYPQMSPAEYSRRYPGQPMYHTGIFLGFDDDGNALILDQYKLDEKHAKTLGKSTIKRKDLWRWNEVYVDDDDSGTSGGGNGQGGGGYLPPSFYSMSGLPLTGTPLTDIGNYFENFGTIYAQVLPGGAVVTFQWRNEPGGNVGAGEMINAFTEGGKKPKDL